MAARRVVVVIPNWNGSEHLEECLAALRGQTLHERMSVVVVDNGSTDDSLAVLARHADLVTVIANPDNLGFAAACNQGMLQERNSEFIALLNNDAIPEPAWLEAMIGAMDGDHRIGSCTPKVLSYDDRGRFDNAGHVVFAD